MTLQGRHILVGITGGIAAYKIPEFVRILQRQGADVCCLVTEKAKRLVAVDALATLTGHPVESDAWQSGGAAHAQHIERAQWADAFVIAPLTANTAAKLANGLADDAVSLTWLSCCCPKLVCPAMNTRMYEAPATQRNLKQLALDGASVLVPDSGHLACGETGAGRLPTLERIAQAVEALLSPKAEQPLHILLTMGRTEEPIDAVRVITNRSSGRTAAAIAAAALARGHRVTVVRGPCEAEVPAGAETVPVRTALEMRAAVLERWPSCNAAVAAAAVADFRPASAADGKIPASRGMDSIALVPNPDILAELCAGRRPGQKVAGFALETGDLERGRSKLARKGADLCVCNDPLHPGEQSGFGEARVWGWIGTPQESCCPGWISKDQLAARLLERLEELSA